MEGLEQCLAGVDLPCGIPWDVVDVLCAVDTALQPLRVRSPRGAALPSERDELWLFLACLDGVRFGALTMALSWV